MHGRPRRELAGPEAAGQRDAVPERRHPGDRPEPGRQLAIGKKVPEKRNIGTRTNRKIAPSNVGRRCRARLRGRGERQPAEEPPAPGPAPPGRVEGAERRPRRRETRRDVTRGPPEARCPRRCRTRSGVATIAWYVRSHLTPAITGNMSRGRGLHRRRRQEPGATNRGSQAPEVGSELSTRCRGATPIEARKKIGLRKHVTSPRQIHR